MEVTPTMQQDFQQMLSMAQGVEPADQEEGRVYTALQANIPVAV